MKPNRKERFGEEQEAKTLYLLLSREQKREIAISPGTILYPDMSFLADIITSSTCHERKPQWATAKH